MKGIVCIGSEGNIGFENKIPWYSNLDFDFFQRITIGKGNNAIIMGRKTYDSIRNVPLKKRRNYIITRDYNKSFIYRQDVIVEPTIENLFFLHLFFDDVFVIGGAQIYSLFAPYIDTWYVSHIHNYSHGDIKFPVDLSSFEKKVMEERYDEQFQHISFCEYSRKIDK
jgi:dihydrofolate reductase